MKKKTYLEQFCDIIATWKTRGVDVDDITVKEYDHMSLIREQAREQSGLTDNELSLIQLCRQYEIFTQVNTFMFQLLEEIED